MWEGQGRVRQICLILSVPTWLPKEGGSPARDPYLLLGFYVGKLSPHRRRPPRFSNFHNTTSRFGYVSPGSAKWVKPRDARPKVRFYKEDGGDEEVIAHRALHPRLTDLRSVVRLRCVVAGQLIVIVTAKRFVIGRGCDSCG